MTLDSELLSLLACPSCKQAVVLLDDEQGLACEACACVYPIQGDIPIMIIEKALPRAEWDKGQRSPKTNKVNK